MDYGIAINSGAHNQLRHPMAESLNVITPSISVDKNNSKVLEMFGKYRELGSLPVLENERPIGLINRNIFMSQMSRQYHREIYDRKSCMAFMDKEPLIVEADMSIDELAQLAVLSGDKALTDGFLIVRQGKFIGQGSGVDLLRVMVDLQAEKNRQIMQSIEYASVIQRAMLSSSSESMFKVLSDACLIWQPRDVVGGDFYHFEQIESGWFAAVGDCTGHGVPGAFLTTIAASSLKQAIQRHNTHDPAVLLGEVSRGIKYALGQQAPDKRLSESDEGMDAAFLRYEPTTRQLTYAGARIALFVLMPNRDGVTVLDGERLGLGYVDTPCDGTWQNRTIVLQKEALVLVATDGLVDQIGGQKNIAYGKRRLREAMLAHRHKSMKAFSDHLMADHNTYQAGQARRDDLTLFGFRVQ